MEGHIAETWLAAIRRPRSCTYHPPHPLATSHVTLHAALSSTVGGSPYEWQEPGMADPWQLMMLRGREAALSAPSHVRSTASFFLTSTP